MLFNSYIFLFVFLPLTLLAFYGVRALSKLQWSVPVLVIASLAFYLASGVFNFGLLLGSILLNFLVSQAARSSSPGKARTAITLGIAADLIILGYFKYFNFFVDNIAKTTGHEVTLHNIALPVGISFFTFTQIAYLVDCYRSRTSERNLLTYALFVTIFPHLVAGPIIHHGQVRPQFDKLGHRAIDPAMIAVGCMVFIIGLGKKILLADNVAGTADLVFNAADGGATIGTAMAWIGTIAYTLQIYFDFSGYSDMAIGLALMFGVKLPINFDSPYKSTSIIEFWRRWHITLSTWLRDYVYIPLGGNRYGELARLRNVFITMLLGGIWHGAGWTFVIWGALHGFYIVSNHLIRKAAPGRFRDDHALMRALKQVMTLLLVMIGWTFFRSGSLDGALAVLQSLVHADPAAIAMTLDPGALPMLLTAALIALFAPNTQQLIRYDEDPRTPVRWRGSPAFLGADRTLGVNTLTALACGSVLALCVAFIWRPSIFIYFNFEGGQVSWGHCLRFVGAIIATAAVLLVLVIALPHDKYLRYKALIDQQAPTADWIYERIHFDPAPINVAFIGTSRTGLSIQSRRLEQKLAEGGLETKVANLHVVRTGSNMHYAVAKELLENRQVDLLVLEITESEERRPHPAFVYLADAEDIVRAPLFVNLRYFDDLVRLPGRQIDLFVRSVMAKLGSSDGRFDAASYKGSNLDYGESITTEDGVVHDRNQVHSFERMQDLLEKQLAHDTPPIHEMLPFLRQQFRELEFRFPRLMMNRVIDLALAKGTRVVLVYLPRYGGPEEPPVYREVFSSKVDMINTKPVLNDARYWWDVPHVNAEGSRRVTDLIAETILRKGYLNRPWCR